MVRFGYRLRKYFTIDCLTASLADNIFSECVLDQMVAFLEAREQFNQKELAERTKQSGVIEKKIETVESRIKAVNPNAVLPTTEPPKKGAKPPAKKGKEVVQSPDEEEYLRLKEELETNQKAIEAYAEKLEKLPELKEKVLEWGKEGTVVDLLDRAGERKFMNVKKETQASEYLGDKNVYHLCRIIPPATPEGK